MKVRIHFAMILVASSCFAQTRVQDTLYVAEDTTPIFRNPGKGWVFYTTWFNTMTPEQVARGSVCYSRFSWADLQPTATTYNWPTIDQQMARCKAAGMRYAFGVMNVSMDWGPDDGYAVPKWVFDSGATYYRVQDIRRPTLFNVIPYWTNNPVFFAKQNAFIQALANRYKGSPDLAWVDIRSYGNWGEGHLGSINKDETGKTIVEPTPKALMQDYFLPYFHAFAGTQLIIPFGHHGFDSTYRWAVDSGMGMRRDGLPDWSDGSDIGWADGKQPTVVEYTDNYTNLVASGVWKDSTVTKAVLRAHASYAEISRGDPVGFIKSADAYMKNLANKIGYHFVLKSISLPWTHMVAKSPFYVSMNWVNLGTTNLYRQNAFLGLALLDSTNKLVDTAWIKGVDPKSWRPGKIAVSDSVTFTKALPGRYTLAVGLFTSKTKTNPDYRIGNSGRDSLGWTHLGPSQSSGSP